MGSEVEQQLPVAYSDNVISSLKTHRLQVMEKLSTPAEHQQTLPPFLAAPRSMETTCPLLLYASALFVLIKTNLTRRENVLEENVDVRVWPY